MCLFCYCFVAACSCCYCDVLQRSDVSDDITADDSDVTIDKRQSREDKITMLEVFHKLNSSVSSCYLQISQVSSLFIRQIF